MPTNYVKKLAKKHHMSPEESENKWENAKEVAKKEKFENNYAYITSVYKKMMKENVLLLKKHNLIKEDIIKYATKEEIRKLFEGIILEHVNPLSFKHAYKTLQDLNIFDLFLKKYSEYENYFAINDITASYYSLKRDNKLDDCYKDMHIYIQLYFS